MDSKMVVAPQFGIKGNTHLKSALESLEKTQVEITASKNEAEAIERGRRVRTERVKQSETAANTLLMAKRGREATEVVVGEIRQLLAELATTREPRDRVWIAKKVLTFTGWRGGRMFDEVRTGIEKVFPGGIPEDVAESLARLVERQEKFLREEAKRKGTMRPGKTVRDHTNGAHVRHMQNRQTAAISQRERMVGHAGNGGKNKKK